MIALDTNILVYAHRRESHWHEPARQRLDALRRTPTPWAIPWPCLHEFLSVVTHPKIFEEPSPLDVAWAAVDAWQAAGNLRWLAESEGYIETLKRISLQAALRGPRIHDARIAALCLHHGVRELWSADRDFSVFPQLRVVNPLIDPDD